MPTESLSAEERVVELLRTFNEARVSYGTGSTGQGVTMMPSMWHEGSYSELERCMVEMRESWRQLWWHVSQRYRWGIESTVVCPVIRYRTGVSVSLPPRSELVAGGPAVGSKLAVCRVYSWLEDVDDRKVETGISVLTRQMQGRIELPLLVLYRRLGMALPPRLLSV